ncbi:helix-turn-helix domain-containing protein [Sulfurimonas sp. SAG-AH-194-C21]|nr:helix-turn-helix transcriptional regulator [Sulfurimonas sp. SAG-AH-194-C21]MDF1883620.1 helix-turn-helix domain-containing protein [Sulfurimonas sp. SAG-AH-194-C21]
MKLHEIGTRIRTLRKEKGITQEQLANISGLSRVTLGKLERGQVGGVSIKTLDIILAHLSYEIEFKSISGFGLATLGE